MLNCVLNEVLGNSVPGRQFANGGALGLVALRSCPVPLMKGKQFAGECHRSSGLLMLCCALMCASVGQWVIMCVRHHDHDVYGC